VRINVQTDISGKVADIVSVVHGGDRILCRQVLAGLFAICVISLSYLLSFHFIHTDVVKMRELMDDGLNFFGLDFVVEGERTHLYHLRCMCWVDISKYALFTLRRITVPIGIVKRS